MIEVEFRLRPVNRHLMIVPHIKKNETTSGVLLPEDFKIEDDRYIEATVVDISTDCGDQFKHLRYSNIDNKKIVVDRTMIEEVKLKGKVYHMILENYVVGVYRRAGEN